MIFLQVVIAAFGFAECCPLVQTRVAKKIILAFRIPPERPTPNFARPPLSGERRLSELALTVLTEVDVGRSLFVFALFIAGHPGRGDGDVWIPKGIVAPRDDHTLTLF